jgi:Zn-dependent protease with chaperone function
MDETTTPPPAASRGPAFFFDGSSSRRREVTLALGEHLEIGQAVDAATVWPYADIRRADAPTGTLRLTCLTAPALARLEIHDAAVAADVISRCTRLDENVIGRRGIAAIVGWSIAAALSIVAVITFGVPLAADRLTPLLPQSFDRRLGDLAEQQVKTVYGGQVCENAAGQAAFTKLVNTLRVAAGLDTSIRTTVLSSAIANAFALPGGSVYLFNGLLAKAGNPDEIAGVLAHEFGHLRHRDGTRNVIYNGGSSFLIGLLFGDITGSSAVIFASRTLVTASYSREVEYAADSVSIEVMHKLGRPTKAMGDLLFRVTGKEGGNGLSILANHPLTEDRLARMSAEDRPISGPPLLTPAEWTALKAICPPAPPPAPKPAASTPSNH